MKESRGIVFVHGIVGNNRIFDFLVPLIPDGYRVKWVVLEGHGGDALGFSRASMDGWKRQVAEAVAEMRTDCEEVVGVGHSMGCLLLLEEALKGNAEALFLLNPPLKLRIRARLFVNSLKVAMGMTEKDEVARAAKAAYGISLDSNPLHYYGWPRRYFELFAEVGRIRKALNAGVPCPATAILSCKDEMVAASSAEIFENDGNATVIMLPESHHYHYPAADRRTIVKAFTKFLEV